MTPCPDCAVAVGDQHRFGCDVARCVGCGQQLLSHGMFGRDDDCPTDLPMQTWTGVWPGEAECSEWGLMYGSEHPRLNDLHDLAQAKVIVWSREHERYVLPSVEDPRADLFRVQAEIVFASDRADRRVDDARPLDLDNTTVAGDVMAASVLKALRRQTVPAAKPLARGFRS